MDKQGNFETAPKRGTQTRSFARAIVFGLSLSLMGIAGSAQANDEFRSGFEYELGRIAANHIAAVSHLVLGFHSQPAVVEVHHAHYVHPGPAHYRPQAGYHAQRVYPTNRFQHRRPVRHDVRAQPRHDGRYDRFDRRGRDWMRERRGADPQHHDRRDDRSDQRSRG